MALIQEINRTLKEKNYLQFEELLFQLFSAPYPRLLTKSLGFTVRRVFADLSLRIVKDHFPGISIKNTPSSPEDFGKIFKFICSDSPSDFGQTYYNFLAGLCGANKREDEANILLEEDWKMLAIKKELFDSHFYASTSPDLSPDSNFIEHYIQVSNNELHRDPSQHFSTSKYLSTYRDVKDSGINALEHYVKHGHDRARFSSNYFEDYFSSHTYALDIDSPQINLNFNNISQYRVAIYIHVFYPEDLTEYLEYLVQWQGIADLLITTTNKEKKIELTQLLNNANILNFKIFIYQENKGRDIGALFFVLEELRLYDCICKLHVKRSPHLGFFGKNWCKYLFMSTIGSVERGLKIISLMMTLEDLGILAPIPFQNTTNSNWGDNITIAKKFCLDNNLMLGDSEFNLLYPSASVFWFKPKAFRKLSTILSSDLFPEEPIGSDGTLAHAVERLIPVLAHNNNFNTVYYRPSLEILRLSKESRILHWINSCSSENPIILIGHEASNSGAPRTALAVQNKIINHLKLQCLTILLQSGPLEEQFSAIGPTLVTHSLGNTDLFRDALKYANKKCIIITNTVVTAEFGKVARDIGHQHIALVHENAYCGFWSKSLFKIALQANCCIFPGRSMLEAALDYSNVRCTGNVQIIPQGIYRDDFPCLPLGASQKSVRIELGIPEDSFIVLGCGTIEERKGFDFFIETAKEFTNRHSSGCQVYFVWVGNIPAKEGPQREWALSELLKVRTLHLDNLILPGSCTFTDRYFAACDLFFMSSVFDPFPGVVLEAMSCKKPIICRGHGTDVQDAFIDQVGGYLIYNIADAVKYIFELYQKPYLSKQMGQHNVDRINSLYRFDLYVERLLSTLKDNSISSQISVMDMLAVRHHSIISVITPLYKTELIFLQQFIESIQSQTYPHWELCVASCQLSKSSESYLRLCAASDRRIKVIYLERNYGIAENTNKALEISSGSYVTFADHDDTLASFALETLIEAHQEGNADLVYSTEDKMSHSGRIIKDEVTKPMITEDTITRNNFVTHMVSVSRLLLDKIGPLNPELDGAQDYDFILKAYHFSRKIVYVDKCLYHWRQFDGSTSDGSSLAKPYAIEAGRKALENYFVMAGKQMRVFEGKIPFTYESKPA